MADESDIAPDDAQRIAALRNGLASVRRAQMRTQSKYAKKCYAAQAEFIRGELAALGAALTHEGAEDIPQGDAPAWQIPEALES